MTELKDTNPKDAVGIRKAPMSAVPAQPLLELGLAMMEGARKYGRHNYRVAGVRASVYYDAAIRHLMAWWEGEDIDPESGLSHLVKAMACLCVIRDSNIRGNWVDDRPPSMTEGWQQPLNKKAGDLIDRLPNSKDPYVKISQEGLLTTASTPSPFPRNPVPIAAASEHTAPTDLSWSPLLERAVPANTVDKSQEA